ncbi:hypothetical protein [Streptosporangium roseum]
MTRGEAGRYTDRGALVKPGAALYTQRAFRTPFLTFRVAFTVI